MQKILTEAGVIKVEDLKRQFMKKWGLVGDVHLDPEGRLTQKINMEVYGGKQQGLYWRSMIRKRATYEEVGKEEGLEGEILNKFLKYMGIRWKDEEERQCKTGYAAEWANRFKVGNEYSASDCTGQSILDSM